MGIMDKLNQVSSLSNYMDNSNDDNIIKWFSLEELNIINNQPFKEYTQSAKYQYLKESIKNNGITNPLIVRQLICDNTFKYDILSGRHRYLVAKDLQLKKIPCLIKKNISDDEANLILLDSNLCQRDELLPSEKAFAYKKKMDILNRKGKRTDLYDDVNKGIESSEMIAKELNTSATDIKRHIRLTYLITDLLSKVDNKTLSFGVGYALSFIDIDNQQIINELIDTNNLKISIKVANQLKELSQKNELTANNIKDILLHITVVRTTKSNVSFKDGCVNEFGSFFEKDTSIDEITNTIKTALTLYFNNGLK